MLYVSKCDRNVYYPSKIDIKIEVTDSNTGNKTLMSYKEAFNLNVFGVSAGDGKYYSFEMDNLLGKFLNIMEPMKETKFDNSPFFKIDMSFLNKDKIAEMNYIKCSNECMKNCLRRFEDCKRLKKRVIIGFDYSTNVICERNILFFQSSHVLTLIDLLYVVYKDLWQYIKDTKEIYFQFFRLGKNYPMYKINFTDEVLLFLSKYSLLR